ncbi:MAG TPA: phosphotransferase, partial [Mycobacterium sp.]|nr:phosphotransferase [Mycobacterium sp.]
MQPTRSAVIERPTDLTVEWLSAALGVPVSEFAFERIGTGQMSECYHVGLTYADGDSGPTSVVLKVAATDPVSRQTGLALGLYEREVRFYTDIAPAINGPVAPCHHAAFDSETGAFHLLLGDAGPAVVGDEIRGATVEQSTLALTELGRMHAPLLGDTTMANAEWLNRESPLNQALIGQLYAGFFQRYRDQIAPEHREVCERLVASFDAYIASEDGAQRAHGLVHGDYRLDNMLFGQDGADRLLTVVDWQTVTWGPAMTDVAYFLGCALPDQLRRAHYDALLQAYHAALGPDAPIGLDDVRDGVRRQSFFGVVMAIVSSMLVAQTERGDEMFMVMLQRHCQHVLDTDALAVLPEAVAAEPLTPAADDEAPHAPTDEPLWNESWYFDFADAGQGFGGWIRLGLYPNQRTAWINALLCGPGMPTVALNDFEAVLPDDPGAVRTDAIDLALEATEPLRTYRVKVRGRGHAHDDPAALLRGEAGRPVELTMDLVWTTAGTPYQYRITPRYEIPCTVSGAVVVDGRELVVDEVAGQRDHSWGVRDWWAMDWVWSALHL